MSHNEAIKNLLESTQDYIQLSEEEVLALFKTDAPINEARFRIEELRALIVKLGERDEAIKMEIDKLDDDETTLRAQIKALDTQRRELKGLIAGNRYHKILSRKRISEREQAISRREKQIVQYEIEKRLKVIGRTLKANVGKRAVYQGRGGHSSEPSVPKTLSS